MTEAEFKQRTKRLAIDIARFVMELPENRVCNVFGHQLLRSGTSVGANYRAACRARSDAEMVAKLGIVEEEADESQYWLELLTEGSFIDGDRAKVLHEELNQIVAMIVASRRTLKKRINNRGNEGR